MRIRISIFLFLLLPVGLCAQIPCTSYTQVPYTSYTTPYTSHTTLYIAYPSPTFSEAFLQFGNKERDRIFIDYGNLYNRHNVKNYGLALLGAGVMANTKIDGNFQAWHGNQVRTDFSNDFSKVSKVFGEGKYFIPVMVTSALSYRFAQEKWGLADCTLGDFTDRTMRGYLVGAPALLSMQLILGGDRPAGEKGSHWRPFRKDHGVSGHAFMGAVPFITAAQMTDRPLAKGVFYTLSTFCAWSRVNDDAHYLSQALLGWYLAYLSVRAVSQTEQGRLSLPRGLTIFPVTENQSIGAGLFYQY